MKKFNYTYASKIFLIAYCIIMLLYTCMFTPRPNGEWDDYSLSASSILTQHDLTISDGDIDEYKNLFPELSKYIDNYSLSGHIAKDGGEMPWYFPTYAVTCIPIIKVLKILGFKGSYGFALTNLASVMIMLTIVLKCLKVGEKRKFAIILLLSINPIIFYFNWISCEVLMYALLGISMVFWYNKWYKSAALVLSVCSTMNPTILMAGIVMIIEYLAGIIMQKPKDMNLFRYIFSRFKEILIYGSCWLISLVPFAYNLYNAGYINLTAAYPRYQESADSVFSRMIAYLFDWNFGMLPYFTLIFVVSLVLIVFAAIRRQWRYIAMSFAFLATAYAYSMMAHVNCGMAGISRYNAWNSVIMIFAVCLFFDKILPKKCLRVAAEVSMAASLALTGITVYSYGINKAMYADYKFMTPAAKMVLEYAPSLYRPLYSTFNSRTIHTDGGYNYKTPVIYCNDEGMIRKILANKNDTELLLKSVHGNDSDMKWFAEKVKNMSDSDQYINVPRSHKLTKAMPYELGTDVVFHSKNYNADKYIINGFWTKENNYSWTNGKEVLLGFAIDSDKKQLHCTIDLHSVYENARDVSCLINNEEVFHNIVNGNSTIEFDFQNSSPIIELKILIPSAEMSKDLTLTDDTRALGLAIKEIKFE